MTGVSDKAIEAAARAIYQIDPYLPPHSKDEAPEPLTWDGATEGIRDLYRGYARAATFAYEKESKLELKDGDEVVLWSEHKRIFDKMLQSNAMLARAVLGAELDLQYNRPVEAHSKLSRAWTEWVGDTQEKAAKSVARKADALPNQGESTE